MGLLGTIFGKQRVQFIQNGTNTIVQLDCSLKETHKRSSPPTEFPIENGDDVSDHIIVKPFNLDITGIISDTPIGGLKGLLTEVATSFAANLLPPVGLVAGAAGVALFNSLTNSKSPSVAAYAQLLQLQQNGTPFDVLTSLYRYPSMWIADLSVPREAESGNMLLFDIKLVQLLLVTPQSVNIQIFANPGLAANQADTGQQGLGNPFQTGNEDAQANKTANSLNGFRG